MRDGFIPSRDGMLGKGVYVTPIFDKALCFCGYSDDKRIVIKLSFLPLNMITITKNENRSK